MPNTIRKPTLFLLVLLLMLTSGSVENCLHWQNSTAGPAASEAMALSAASHDDCCDTGHAEEHDGSCHSCACFCHSTAILSASLAVDGTAPAGRLVRDLLFQPATGFQSNLDRPPLQS